MLRKIVKRVVVADGVPSRGSRTTCDSLKCHRWVCAKEPRDRRRLQGAKRES